jgi:hypothetical protein
MSSCIDEGQTCMAHIKYALHFATSAYDLAGVMLIRFLQQVTLRSANGTSLCLTFSATLLQLRGSHRPASIPLYDEPSGDVLCFNGEIFGGLHILAGRNDGEALLEALINCSGGGTLARTTAQTDRAIFITKP